MHQEETALYFREPRLPGVELLKATFVRQNFARHVHDCYALGVIERGVLRFDYLRREHVAPVGSVNLVVPGEAHNGDAGQGPGWSYRMLYLDPELVAQAVGSIGQRSGLPHFSQGVLHDPGLAARVRALHLVLEQGGRSLLELEARLSGLLTHWVARHAENSGPWPRILDEPRAVHRVREYLDAHFAEDVRLETLARVGGLSPFHLTRVFAKAVGVPPSRYQTQLRVAAARGLLSGGTPLTDVAATCGFADQSHLTREFKRILGVPPGRYRKMLQDQHS